MPQIIYNVTCNVETDIANEWITWMRSVHIPEVMQTGLFISYKFMQVIGPAVDEEDSGKTYAVQYILPNIENFLTYKALKEKTFQKYGERVLAFRTLLEMMED